MEREAFLVLYLAVNKEGKLEATRAGIYGSSARDLTGLGGEIGVDVVSQVDGDFGEAMKRVERYLAAMVSMGLKEWVVIDRLMPR